MSASLRHCRFAACAAGLVLVGCSQELSIAPVTAITIAGDAASVAPVYVVQPMTGAPRVRVLRNGAPAAQVPVRFFAPMGSGQVTQTMDTSDAQGWADAGVWTAGSTAGPQRLLAFVPTNGTDATFEFIVNVPPGPSAGVTIEPRFVPLEVGGSTGLTATLRDAFGNAITTSAPAVWTSLQPSVATVTSGGSVSAVASGWAQVSVAADGWVDTAFVGVAGGMPALTVDSADLNRGLTVAVSSAGRGLLAGAFQNLLRFDPATLTSTGDALFLQNTVDVAFSPGTDIAWIAEGTTPQLIKFDAATNTALDTFPLPASPIRVVPSPDGAWLYVSAAGAQLLRVNATTGAVASAALPGAGRGLVISPDGAALYATNTTGGLYRVNAATLAVTQAVQLGGTPGELVLSADGTRLFVARVTGGGVVRRASDLSAIGSLPAVGVVNALALTGDDALLIMASSATGQVHVVDAFSFALRLSRATAGVQRLAPVPGSPDLLMTQTGGRVYRLRF